MKKIMSVLFLASMFITLAAAEGEKAKAVVILNSDIDCNKCKEKIEKNIPFEKGVKDLKVSLKEKTVTIVYRKDKTTAETLCNAVTKLGYNSSIKYVSDEK